MGSNKHFDPNNLYEKLMRATNAAGQQHFNDQHEEIKVNINPDTSVSPGNFKPDLLHPGHYKAHPTTIRAMRKDIFVGGSDEFLDLEKTYICNSCHSQLDLQFWHFCPYCEAEFPSDLGPL